MANLLFARSFLRHAAGSVARHQATRVVAAPVFQKPAFRTFSSSSEELTALIAREMVEEQENAAMPQELEELMEDLKADWRIVDDESNGTIKLFRNSGKVAINFHCQESLQQDMYEGQEDDEESEEAAAPVRFTVTTSKAGKTLVLWCLSEGGAATVEGLAVSNADADKIFVDGIEASSYQGPEFSELPADLQDAFTEYVHTDCGISSDVAAFIAMYADYKEQTQYVSFLKQVESIIQ